VGGIISVAVENSYDDVNVALGDLIALADEVLKAGNCYCNCNP